MAESLAETALGDAIIAGVSGRHLLRAQDALTDAFNHASKEHYDKAIEELGIAWREAQLALR